MFAVGFGLDVKIFVLSGCLLLGGKLLSLIIKRLKSKENGLKMAFYLRMCKKSVTFAKFLTISQGCEAKKCII